MGRFFISTIKKQAILDAQGNNCAYCDAEFTVLNPPGFDHFIPHCAGGPTNEGNMFACCHKCNNRKNDLRFNSLESLRAWIAAKQPGELLCDHCGKAFTPQIERKGIRFCSHSCRTSHFSLQHYYQNKEKILAKRKADRARENARTR